MFVVYFHAHIHLRFKQNVLDTCLGYLVCLSRTVGTLLVRENRV